MGIGTSTGQYFDDAFHQASSSYVQEPQPEDSDKSQSPQKQERLYVSPNDIRPIGIRPPDAYRAPPDLSARIRGHSEEGSLINPEGSPGDPNNFEALTRDQNEYDADQNVNIGNYREHLGAIPKNISDVEDQRDQSILGAVGSHIGDQLNMDKIKAIAQHPWANVSQTMIANQPVPDTQMGRDLGLGSIPAPEASRSVTDKLFGITGDRYQTWPERAVRGALGAAMDAFTLPGDVMSGKVQSGSEEEIKRSANLAGLMVGAPAPVASRMADGTLGSFAGVRSQTMNKDLLEHAKWMEKQGSHENDIWEQTGFFKGSEGKWRYEIPDDKAALNSEKLNPTYVSKTDPAWDRFGIKDPEGPEGHKLPDVLYHPDLYKAYPHLKDIEVKPVPWQWTVQGMKGAFDTDKNILYVGNESEKGMLSVIMHEIQHSIQSKEGFEYGTNQNVLTPNDLQELYGKYNTVRATAEQETKDLIGSHSSGLADLPAKVKETSVSQAPKGWENKIGWGDEKDPEHIYNSIIGLMKTEMRTSEPGPYGVVSGNTADNRNLLTMIRRQYPEVYDKIENIVKSDKVVEDKKSQILELYRRAHGEVEARNVQHRLDMENLDRFSTHPRETEDRPRFVQYSAPSTEQASDERDLSRTKFPMIPKNAQEELDQLLENRRTNKLMGYNTEGPDYKYYNDRIEELKKIVSKNSKAPVMKPKKK